MEETILLVGHGSRNKEGNREIEKFASRWREMHPDWRIDVCFIEFADLLLPRGLSRAAADSRRVIVVPLILNAAGHVKMEIPGHIEEARKAYPRVEFIYARHLGCDEEILGILKGRLAQVMKSLHVPDPQTTGIVLLGRGSSDMVANGEVAKMARWLFEESDHQIVDFAFTGITYPRLETSVSRLVRLGMGQIIVLPYYLFTGVLMERIKNQMVRLEKQHPQVTFGLGDYLGFDAAIYSLLDKRVAEARGEERGETTMMECDGCKYRSSAEGESGHHHHHHAHP